MQNILFMEIVGSLSENGFSLDELVIKTKELFEQKGMAGFISLLLRLADEHICTALLYGKSSWRPNPCCDQVRYISIGNVKRTFRTSAGTVKIRWRRLQCASCGRSTIPLRQFLGLKHYQSKTSELEMIVSEVVSDQSYRRSSKHLDLIGEIPVPRSTAHRWVMESDCDQIEVDGKVVDSLFVDSTGYKRRPDPEKEHDNRGDLRLLLGVKGNGEVVPFGCWSGTSWKDIGQQIRKKSVGASSVAKVLIRDGEKGLDEALAQLVEDQQRCHWHMVRDLDFAMWHGDAKKSERLKMQSRLNGIIGIELPHKDFQQVSAEDKLSIERSTAEAQQKIEKLIKELFQKGYDYAARYVRHAKDRLFTYVRMWLKYGLVCARATSMIERMIREIGRRLKRIAFGWSEKGAAKMARIIIKRITSAGEWDQYWRKRLRINDNVILVYRGVKAK